MGTAVAYRSAQANAESLTLAVVSVRTTVSRPKPVAVAVRSISVGVHQVVLALAEAPMVAVAHAQTTAWLHRPVAVAARQMFAAVRHLVRASVAARPTDAQGLAPTRATVTGRARRVLAFAPRGMPSLLATRARRVTQVIPTARCPPDAARRPRARAAICVRCQRVHS